MRLGEVQDFCSEALIVYPVVEVAGREALGVSLQGMDLLDLTSIRQADVLYTKDIGGIVAVGGNLA